MCGLQISLRGSNYFIFLIQLIVFLFFGGFIIQCFLEGTVSSFARIERRN
jgi:hypothetical protein